MKFLPPAAIRPFLILFSVSIVLGILCFYFAFPKANLFPNDNNEFPWRLEPGDDKGLGGDSTIRLEDQKVSIDFSYKLSHKAKMPGVGVTFNFEGFEKQKFVDLSPFSTISFDIKCSPKNILYFSIATFDEKVSVIGNPLSYRAPSVFFKCEEQWTQAKVDLKRMEVPLWWIGMFKMDAANKDYSLQKVLRMQIATTFESQFDVNSRVQVSNIELHGERFFIIYLYIAAMFISWLGFLFWYFKLVTKDIESRASTKKQFVGYQQLNLEPLREKEKSALLKYLSTNYAKPDIDIEKASKELGITRAKINEMLKAEVGYTFTAYLNKLRITEAARLLAEKADANITEIVYVVGYTNISYFNKLFKEEFSCTPKAYKLQVQAGSASNTTVKDSGVE